MGSLPCLRIGWRWPVARGSRAKRGGHHMEPIEAMRVGAQEAGP